MGKQTILLQLGPRYKPRIYIVVLCLSIIISIFPSASSSNAVFGLSKCEKFKKQLIALETQFNTMTSRLNSYQGKILTGKIKTDYENFRNSDLLQQMYKSSYNNNKCLTNTQNDYVKLLKNYSTAQFVEIDIGEYFKNTAYCKKSLNMLKPECVNHADDKIAKAYLLPSLFDQ